MQSSVVTVKKIIAAQRLCVADVPGTSECEKCYLYAQRNAEGILDDGQVCYCRLAGDTIALIKSLNDFENSQHKLLIMEITRLKKLSESPSNQTEPTHCCECEYTSVGKDDVRWCRLSQGLDGNRKDTDFCSYAKRKESSND